MNAENRKKLAGLLSKLVDSKANSEEVTEIDRLIKDDLEAQKYYVRYLAVHLDLEKCLQAPQPPTIFPNVSTDSGWHSWIKFGVLMLGLVMLGGLQFYFWQYFQSETYVSNQSNRSIETERRSALTQRTIFAVLGFGEDAAWNLMGISPQAGSLLSDESVYLERGRIRLDFPAGEQVTIGAPASFRILSPNRMEMSQGKLMASVPEEGTGFTVVMPNGAVVDLGTEFAIDVEPEGVNRVRVIQGQVIASSTNYFGSTSWEKLLGLGDEFVIEKNSPPSRATDERPYIEPLKPTIAPLPVRHAYTEAVLESKPVGYWKFDRLTEDGSVENEVATNKLELKGNAIIKSVEAPSIPADINQGFLYLDHDLHRGFAISSESFEELITEDGCSIEFWVYSDSVKWQILATLILDGPTPATAMQNLDHKPTSMFAERTGRERSNISHIHPDFSIRSVFRSQPDYRGGVNTYSSHSHLMHRWHHVVIVKNQESLQVFIDGDLSSESSSFEKADPENHFLLIGRMHPLATNYEARQFSGGIDEFSIYNRALSPSEVRRHFQANSTDWISSFTN